MSFSAQFDTFHERATQATGLSDFGSDDYHAPLRLLLSDLDTYPRLSEIGVTLNAEQITGLLAARLMRQHGIAANPAAAATPVARPIFIVGMARTGTTALHRLITADPGTQSLPFWLGNMPMPRPPRETWEANPVFQRIRQALAESVFLNDELRKVHPVDAHIADECRWVIDQTFWTSTFALTTPLPNYLHWFCTADVRYAYDYHRRTLALVANGDTRPWVLKDPAHIFGMDSLLAVYPDACIVQTHREPVDCMRSISHLAWLARRQRMEEGATALDTGSMLLESWATGLKKMERVRAAHDAARFMDIHISELQADPVGTVERIYDHFGLPVTAEARAAWQHTAAADRHEPSAAAAIPDYGLTRENVNAELGAYLERFRAVEERARVALAR